MIITNLQVLFPKELNMLFNVPTSTTTTTTTAAIIFTATTTTYNSTGYTMQNVTQQQPRNTVQKLNQKHVHPRVILFQPPRDTSVKFSLVATPLVAQAAQMPCRCKHGLFTNKTCVHPQILLRIEASAAVRKAFSNRQVS